MAKSISRYFAPALAKRFSRFFDQEAEFSDLNKKRRLICLIAAAQAAFQPRALSGLIAWALDSRITVDEIYEVLLQGHLFCGYPRAIESFIVLKETLKDPNYLPSRETESIRRQNPNSLKLRGLSLARRIYGGNFDLVFRNIIGLSPELAEGMIAEGYGRIISRGGLDIVSRELAIISGLTVTGMPRQLYSHIRGAINVGAKPRQIEAAVRQCRLFANAAFIRRALRTFEKSLGKRSSAK